MKSTFLTALAMGSILGSSVSAQEIPRGMVAGFVITPTHASRCPVGWEKFSDASGRLVTGAIWNGDAAVYAAPSDGNLNAVKVAQENLPPLSVDFRGRMKLLPADPRPNVFQDEEINLYGTTGTQPGWENSMHGSAIVSDIGGSSAPLKIEPPTVTLMMCKKR
jgi:hypothetical protein